MDSMELWGTLIEIGFADDICWLKIFGFADDICWLILTLWQRFVTKTTNQQQRQVQLPYQSNFASKIWWHMVSNAFLKSMNIFLPIFLESKVFMSEWSEPSFFWMYIVEAPFILTLPESVHTEPNRRDRSVFVSLLSRHLWES